MQQADTAGSTRDANSSPGNRRRISTTTVHLDLHPGSPLIAQHLVSPLERRIEEIDNRIDDLMAVVALLSGLDELDKYVSRALGHIWQSLDDLRALTSPVALSGIAA
ncbi:MULTISPECIES: hypothetical protein [Sphingomonas]|uniref:hypothetical protein n=1 Tax=Sphingomonas TaxID=13687 RepID=UPI000A3F5AF2|nr:MULTISPECIES: hypothetical protein [Sphingomonas]